MTDRAPTLSILATVYNKAPVLAQTLRNLQGQTDCPPFEIVCADDGSTDGSGDILRAAAAQDPRLVICGDARNRGPAIRLNEAAAAARGSWLLPVDGDDYLAPNGAGWLVRQAVAHGAQAVFARARRGPPPDATPPQATAQPVAGSALAFAAANQLSHMGFLASRALWQRAGGADETVFIQDQSVQLRLCRHADRILWTDATVYALRPAARGSLSDARAQQHHDRYLAYWRLLQAVGPADPAAPALRATLLSTLWKLRRDGFVGGAAPAPLSAAHARYLANRLFGLAPSPAFFARHARALSGLAGVRRPPEQETPAP